MRRSLLAGAIATALLTTQQVQALGLGEAEVQSFLNQPLKVRIPIIIENEGERESLRVDLASNDDFRRVGLDRAALGLNMEVELHENGSDLTVLLSSTNPVRDPFLQVLLNADWSSGRLLRQYTLFLDPPLLEKPSIQVRNEPPPAPTSNRRPSAAAAAAAAAGSGSGASRPQIDGNRYGPVAAGETLWSIASRSNPNSRDYSVNQVMLAYVRLNPEAFDRGNVNSLRRGASLSVPGTADIAVVNAQEALRIVQQQHREWRPGFSGGSSGSASSNAGGASSGGSSNRRASVPDGRLQLVPPDESTAAFTNSAGLKAELARLEEELLTAKLENRDLVQQVDNLRQQIAALDGGGVQDKGLAEFQNYLSENRDKADERGEESYVDPFVNQGFDSDSGDSSGSDSNEAGLAGGSDAQGSNGQAGDNQGATADTTTATGAQADNAAATTATVTQNNTPPTITSNQPPAAAPAKREEGGFFSTLTVAILAIGVLAVGLLIWVQRRRDQQPGGKREGDKPAKSRFSAKNMLPSRKDKKDKGEDKKSAGKKSGAASLADRLIEASKQQQGPAAGAALPAAGVAAAAAAGTMAKAPPSVDEFDTDFGDTSYDDEAYDELDGVDAPPPPPPAPPPPAPPPPPPPPPPPMEEPVEEESAEEDDFEQGLDFILDDPEPEMAESEEDPTEALLRRMAGEEDEPEEAQQEEEDGLDFDLSGMEHLISSTGAEDDPLQAAEEEEEDPYAAVLRGMADDDEISAAMMGDDDLGDVPGLAGPDEDEVEIKLDLARAYISMGDNEAASTILDEILSEGTDVQRAEARNLLKQI